MAGSFRVAPDSASGCGTWRRSGMHRGQSPRQHIRPHRPPNSMKRVIFTLPPILVALTLLPPIAFASLPDPLWIEGIFAAADDIEIVTLVYEFAGVETTLLQPIPPLHRRSEISHETRSPLPGKRGPVAAQRHRLQPRQSPTPARLASRHPGLVAHEPSR